METCEKILLYGAKDPGHALLMAIRTHFGPNKVTRLANVGTSMNREVVQGVRQRQKKAMGTQAPKYSVRGQRMLGALKIKDPDLWVSIETFMQDMGFQFVVVKGFKDRDFDSKTANELPPLFVPDRLSIPEFASAFYSPFLECVLPEWEGHCFRLAIANRRIPTGTGKTMYQLQEQEELQAEFVVANGLQVYPGLEKKDYIRNEDEPSILELRTQAHWDRKKKGIVEEEEKKIFVAAETWTPVAQMDEWRAEFGKYMKVMQTAAAWEEKTMWDDCELTVFVHPMANTLVLAQDWNLRTLMRQENLTKDQALEYSKILTLVIPINCFFGPLSPMKLHMSNPDHTHHDLVKRYPSHYASTGERIQEQVEKWNEPFVTRLCETLEQDIQVLSTRPLFRRLMVDNVNPQLFLDFLLHSISYLRDCRDWTHGKKNDEAQDCQDELGEISTTHMRQTYTNPFQPISDLFRPSSPILLTAIIDAAEKLSKPLPMTVTMIIWDYLTDMSFVYDQLTHCFGYKLFKSIVDYVNNNARGIPELSAWEQGYCILHGMKQQWTWAQTEAYIKSICNDTGEVLGCIGLGMQLDHDCQMITLFMDISANMEKQAAYLKTEMINKMKTEEHETLAKNVWEWENQRLLVQQDLRFQSWIQMHPYCTHWHDTLARIPEPFDKAMNEHAKEDRLLLTQCVIKPPSISCTHISV